VGNANASLIMTCCRANDGLILKPDRPATTMDAAFASVFTAKEVAADLPIANVASTYSTHVAGGSPIRWQYVMAMTLAQPFTVRFTDLGPSFGVTNYVAFDYFNPLAGGPYVNASSPHVIQTGQGVPGAPSDALAMRYHVLAPVLPGTGGWVVLGELGKVVPMSVLRVTSFTTTASGFSATVAAASSGATETVTYAVIPPAGSRAAAAMMPSSGAGVATVVCTLRAGAAATLTCASASGCTCA
jgi:hypothetical protein